MSIFGNLMAQGLRVSQSIGAAKQAYTEWQEAIATAAPTLAETDLAKLQSRLEAVHAESMAMSSELEQAIAAARRR